MFNKMAEISVAILDYMLFFCVFTVVWNEDRNFWDIWNIFEIFRKIFWDIFKKNQEFPETYLGHFWWYLYLGLLRSVEKQTGFKLHMTLVVVEDLVSPCQVVKENKAENLNIYVSEPYSLGTTPYSCGDKIYN